MNYNNYTAEDFACNESFVRFYLNEDEEDVHFWEHWIEEHPLKTNEVKAAQKILSLLTLALPQSELEDEIKKMQNHIYDTAPTNSTLRISPIEVEPQKVIRRFPFLKIAASIILLIGLGTFAFMLTTRTEEVTQDADVEELTVKANAKGQKSIIQLSDGSTVNLNANSEIRFFESFSKERREIELEGEAFFEVASDPLRPFVVKTSDMSICALGTSFNVRAYGETEALKVALITGKVEVSIIEDSLVNKSFLTPGEGLTFNKKNHLITKEKFDPDYTLAWRKGILYFKNASWSHIVLTLERWYNVELVVKNQPLTSSPYTGQFDNQSLELVLESLSFSKDFTYSINGKKIKIDFSPQP